MPKWQGWIWHWDKFIKLFDLFFLMVKDAAYFKKKILAVEKWFFGSRSLQKQQAILEVLDRKITHSDLLEWEKAELKRLLSKKKVEILQSTMKQSKR